MIIIIIAVVVVVVIAFNHRQGNKKYSLTLVPIYNQKYSKVREKHDEVLHPCYFVPLETPWPNTGKQNRVISSRAALHNAPET